MLLRYLEGLFDSHFFVKTKDDIGWEFQEQIDVKLCVQIYCIISHLFFLRLQIYYFSSLLLKYSCLEAQHCLYILRKQQFSILLININK